MQDPAETVDLSKETWRVFVYGGCVSRDTVAFADPQAYNLVKYVARNSLLSVGTDARASLPELVLPSAFQKKMVDLDASGHLLKELRQMRGVDVILWDLNIERSGVWRFDDGSIATNSAELKRVEGISPVLENARFIAFGSEEHYSRWCAAATMFVAILKELELKDRLLVLAPEWAVRDIHGGKNKKVAGKSIDFYNDVFSTYLAHLENLGVTILRLADTTSDPDHKWGSAPFHYEKTVYRKLDEEIRIFARKNNPFDRGVGDFEESPAHVLS
ncbi:DUF6270 domain-containing protein [Corynebacterium sp. c8Ua_181]|uniref:DUF6270 domain-containing protein n=1 Tax=Corynebacterium curieae TaxID=2913500 RepID=A0A9X3M9F9_9CORY|nr:DUF6270 domain-containing protein [Corynebacterium curieae]MCZ9306429.1 DUF6270 domain-containing protein [Corynebacterium curieae]MDV2424002.1 DUF6270 domain-containing protein [Corynebacterium curieae]